MPAKDSLFNNERIPGDSDFAADVITEADEAIERKPALAAQDVSLQRMIDLAADLVSMALDRIAGSGKAPEKAKARRFIC